jgi:hypothetical protein
MARKEWIEEQLDLHVSRLVEATETIRTLRADLETVAEGIAIRLGKCIHRDDCDCWDDCD